MSEQPFGRGYSGNAARNYEQYFVPAIGGPVAAAFMASIEIAPDDRVLDVACGTGVVTRLAAERAAHVTGVDINPGMLEVAREAVPSNASIEWQQASADSMPLPDESFDLVLCALSMQFFPDKPAALQEMKRVLVPGGRLAINLPRRIPPIFQVMDEAVARHIGPEAAAFVRAVFSLHDPDEVRRLLTDQGYDGVQTETRTLDMTVTPPREFLWQYVHSTPLTAAASQADDERLAALERDVVEGWQPFVKQGRLAATLDIVIATASKPAA